MLSVAVCCLLPPLKTCMRAAMIVAVHGTCANPPEGPPSRASALQTTGAPRQHPSIAPSERETRPESVTNAQRLRAAALRWSLAVQASGCRRRALSSPGWVPKGRSRGRGGGLGQRGARGAGLTRSRRAPGVTAAPTAPAGLPQSGGGNSSRTSRLQKASANILRAPQPLFLTPTKGVKGTQASLRPLFNLTASGREPATAKALCTARCPPRLRRSAAAAPPSLRADGQDDAAVGTGCSRECPCDWRCRRCRRRCRRGVTRRG